jgi:hypothetical protein
VGAGNLLWKFAFRTGTGCYFEREIPSSISPFPGSWQLFYSFLSYFAYGSSSFLSFKVCAVKLVKAQ